MGWEGGRMIKVLKSFIMHLWKNSPIWLLGVTVLLWFIDSAYANDCKTLEEYQEEYKVCYACMTMSVMMEAFMTAASQTYSLSQEGGIALLLLGSPLWIAFFTIKKISSFTNPEAPKMVNEFLVFMFKVLFAYVMIKAGVNVLVDYFVNPILAAGADLGTAFLSFGLPAPDNVVANPSFHYEGPTDVLDPTVMDKILAFTEGVSIKVANSMVIGNGLMCFAADAYDLKIIVIPNIWLWLCGAVIWVIGFLLTLFICYYLLDITFKIGFAIILLPIAIGLWPFGPTKGRVKACFSIILRSSAIYAILAICATLATILIDEVLDVDLLFQYIKDDNLIGLEQMFSIFRPHFLLLCVGFLYAIRLIGKNETLVNKLFPDNIFGAISPIHNRLTSATNSVKQTAMKPFGLTRDIATHQTGRAIRGVGKGIGKGVSAAGKATGKAIVNKYKAIKAANQAKNALKK